MLTWWILAACGALSAVSVVLAAYALLRAEKPRLIALEKRVGDLDMAVIGLTDSYESARKSIRRMNSRYAMREKRANGANGHDPDMPDPTTDPEGWRAAMQRKYPRGVFDYNGRK